MDGKNVKFLPDTFGIEKLRALANCHADECEPEEAADSKAVSGVIRGARLTKRTHF